MKHLLVTVLLLSAACKKGQEPANIAPPIADGKCVADHYEGATATKQICTWQGYGWNCGPANCDRIAETVGERPIAEPAAVPVSAPAPATPNTPAP